MTTSLSGRSTLSRLGPGPNAKARRARRPSSVHPALRSGTHSPARPPPIIAIHQPPAHFLSHTLSTTLQVHATVQRHPTALAQNCRRFPARQRPPTYGPCQPQPSSTHSSSRFHSSFCRRDLRIRAIPCARTRGDVAIRTVGARLCATPCHPRHNISQILLTPRQPALPSARRTVPPVGTPTHPHASS